LPDVSTRHQSIHASRLLLCMGLFSIFWEACHQVQEGTS
jgi:hypothetical protein